MAFLSAAGFTASSLIGAGSALVSGAAGLIGAIRAKQTADINAEIADDNAKRSIHRSEVEQQESDMMTLGKLGEQEAAQSASGLAVTSRSNVLTRVAARKLGRLDALNIRQAGELEAHNFRVEGMNARLQGKAALAEGVGGLIGSFFKAGGSLIGGTPATKMGNRVNDPWQGLRRKTV